MGMWSKDRTKHPANFGFSVTCEGIFEDRLQKCIASYDDGLKLNKMPMNTPLLLEDLLAGYYYRLFRYMSLWSTDVKLAIAGQDLTLRARETSHSHSCRRQRVSARSTIESCTFVAICWMMAELKVIHWKQYFRH